MMAGRNWRTNARRPVSRGSWLAGSTGVVVAVLALSQHWIDWVGWESEPCRLSVPFFMWLLFLDLVGQIERGQDQVDRLDADKRQDDPADAVNQQVSP